MEEQIFCDGIGRIAIIGGLVRLDLFTYSPTETDANGNPRPVLSHRIVMGMDGFMHASEKVVEAVQVIQRARQPQQQPQPPRPQAPPPPVQHQQQAQPVPTPAPQMPQWPPHAAQPAPPPVQPAPPAPRPQAPVSRPPFP